jgi:methylmalonyl-CoA/ethylmalonyl-CoA epimerase
VKNHLPLSYVANGLHQVAFVVRDLEAAQKFFNDKMGIPRFCVLENFSEQITEKMFRGRSAEQTFKLAMAYWGNVQVELIQHVSGETCYQEFLDRRGEGLHHLGFFRYERDQYEKAAEELARSGYAQLMSGRLGESRYAYFDTEAAIGSVMEIIYLDPDGRELMKRIKRGDF